MMLINDGRLLLLHHMRLFEQVTCHHLHDIEHLVVLVNLLQLVQVVQESVLGLVDSEHVGVGAEERVDELLWRDDSFDSALRHACLDVISSQAQNIKLLKRRDLGQAVVKGCPRSQQAQRLTEAEFLWNLQFHG